MIKLKHRMGLHESIMKKIHSDSLNERAELNTKRIEYMELNELLAALKEEIEEDINYNLEFFRVVTGYENGKAYIDIESKDSYDIAFFEGAFSVDDILDMTERDIKEYGLPKEDVDAIKGQILIERDKLIKRIIPNIARKWGFRNIKNSTTENIDSINESVTTDKMEEDIIQLENKINDAKLAIENQINDLSGEKLTAKNGYEIIVNEFSKWDSIKTIAGEVPFAYITDAEYGDEDEMPFVDKSLANFGFDLGDEFVRNFRTVQNGNKTLEDMKAQLERIKARTSMASAPNGGYNYDENGAPVDLARWLQALEVAEMVDASYGPNKIKRQNYEHWPVVCDERNVYGESYPVFINGSAGCRFIAENEGGDIETAGKQANLLYDACDGQNRNRFRGHRWEYADPDNIKRKIKELFNVDADQYRKTHANESLDEAKRDIETPYASDLIEVNLFNEGWMSGDPWFKLAEHPQTKYIGENGDIITSNYYSRPLQASFDGDGENQIIKLYLLEKGDEANAEDLVNKFGLTGKFLNYERKKDGYNYIYAIYIPNRLYDMNVAEFIKEQQISPELFKYPKKIEKHLKWGR